MKKWIASLLVILLAFFGTYHETTPIHVNSNNDDEPGVMH